MDTFNEMSGDFRDGDSFRCALHFPMELTNTDYLRRLLDICTLGIRTRLLDIIIERQLQPIPVEHDHDLEYLLQHLLGGPPDGGVPDAMQAASVRETIADALGSHTDALFRAATFLLQQRRALKQSSVTSRSREVLLSSFTQAVELLICFGASATKALRSMRLLMAQYREHWQFKQTRLPLLGWSTDTINSYVEHDFFYEHDDNDASTDSYVDILRAMCTRPSDLYTAGFEPRQLADPGYISTGIRDGFSVSELRAAGYSAMTLKAVDFCASDLKAAGYTAMDMKEAGYTVSELATAGYSIEALLAAGLRVPLLLSNGYDARALRRAGYSASELKGAEYTAWQLKSAGFSVNQMLQAAYPLTELSGLGYTVLDFHTAGVHAGRLKEAGYDASELQQAGYTALEASQAGYSVVELHDAGYPVLEVVKTGCTLHELFAAGYTALELSTLDWPAADLLQVGYSIAELKTAGYSARELKEGQATVDALLMAGFTVQDVQMAGYAARSLKNTAYAGDLGMLKAAGYSALELANAGYAAVDIKAAGYTTDDFNRSLREAVALWQHDRSVAMERFGAIVTWDVREVTSMHQLFRQAVSFNEDISAWDVRHVRDMRCMFEGAIAFNQPLAQWKVSADVDVTGMLRGASAWQQQSLGWLAERPEAEVPPAVVAVVSSPSPLSPTKATTPTTTTSTTTVPPTLPSLTLPEPDILQCVVVASDVVEATVANAVDGVVDVVVNVAADFALDLAVELAVDLVVEVALSSSLLPAPIINGPSLSAENSAPLIVSLPPSSTSSTSAPVSSPLAPGATVTDGELPNPPHSTTDDVYGARTSSIHPAAESPPRDVTPLIAVAVGVLSDSEGVVPSPDRSPAINPSARFPAPSTSSPMPSVLEVGSALAESPVLPRPSPFPWLPLPTQLEPESHGASSMPETLSAAAEPVEQAANVEMPSSSPAESPIGRALSPPWRSVEPTTQPHAEPKPDVPRSSTSPWRMRPVETASVAEIPVPSSLSSSTPGRCASTRTTHRSKASSTAVVFTEETLREAAALLLVDRAKAIATYGPIAKWKVSPFIKPFRPPDAASAPASPKPPSPSSSK